MATGGDRIALDFELVVAEPGWTMHMVSHFHYDPVWWNTQAAYTTAWNELDFPGSPRGARQLAGFDLVRAHLDLALAEPEYRFVLAEVDYLKPYWDTHPEHRAVLRRLIAEGRVEIMGGAYNEPNTNLTDPETTVRNFVHGMGFQVDVLGGQPRTAWQLDAFGHDPAFPGLAADAGLTSSSWARGPFHQWGPMERTDAGKGDPERMQFPSEFEWISPSGRGVLTAYMTDHYGSGWGMDSAPSLSDAGEAAYQVFVDLKKVATTRNVLLPVGGDYTPPNKWVTAVHHDWARRYVWPRFVCSLPRDFFAAVRAELDERGVTPTPQTRDMNPIYTGKDVSYIDTKQAQRAAETALLEAETYAVFASLLTNSAYPDAALAKAWVQLAYGAHHDAITGSESDQVYLDLLTSWRDAHDLAADVRDRALTALSGTVTTDGRSVVVWNPLDHPRTDLVTVRFDEPVHGVVLDDGQPVLVEHDGRSVTFLAEVPALGWRAYRIRESEKDSRGWVDADGHTATGTHHRVTVDPDRGGGVASLVELATGRELIADGRIGNELAVYEEYPQHPRFSEGPWHLVPKGPVVTSAASAAAVQRQTSPLGERLTVAGAVGPVTYTQTITLWHGVERIDCVTTVDEFTGSDQLLRVRWPCPVPGALPVSEVGNAVVGRGFGLIDVDSEHHPWTLDNPAHTWFGLSATAALRLGDGALRPIGVAEIIVPTEADAGPLARELAAALARSGVTSTVSTADGPRYGNLEVDSNLPDVRISIGGPDANTFTAEVLDRAGATAGVRGAFWVPPEKPLREVWQPSADLRDARALGVLVLTAPSSDELPAVVKSIVDDLADHVIEVGAGNADYAERTVALLNRGLPGFAVDSAGTLHASLLRSCTGWPSGVWIDPPRRTAPDGSNFQLQHWTHQFDYAIVAGDGDWRQAGISAASAAFSRPLLAVPVAGNESNLLPDKGSLLEVEPVGKVRLAAFKAAGNPLPAGSATAPDPRRVALRLVGHLGEPVTARVRSDVLDLTDPAAANLLEQQGNALEDLAVEVPGCDAVTVLATASPRASIVDTTMLGVEAEPAQPLYTKYWLHNRGPAPLGGLPIAVHLDPTSADVEASGSVLRLTVASDCTDADVHGVVTPRLPDGWRCEPDEVPFGLPPGGHLATELTVHAPAGAEPGRYPIRAVAELAGDALPASWRQPVEDVAILSVAGSSVVGSSGTGSSATGSSESGSDLIRIVGDPKPVRVTPGERGRVSVRVASAAAAPLAVEAALISPWGTWELAGPRAIGAELPAHGEVELGFDLTPPPWTPPTRSWVLIKVTGAGRLLYSPAVSLEVLP